MLLVPVLLLLFVNLASWRASHAVVRRDEAHCRPFFPTTFFGGTTLIFLFMALAQLLSYCVNSAPSSLRSPTAPPSTTDPASPRARLTRRHHKLCVLLGLLVLGIASIVWAAVGWAWIARATPQDSGSLRCSESHPSLRKSMSLSIALLFVIGGVLLTLTLCCRLEDFILASNGIPTIDPDILSPKLMRHPASHPASQPASQPALSSREQLREAASTADLVD